VAIEDNKTRYKIRALLCSTRFILTKFVASNSWIQKRKLEIYGLLQGW